MHAGPGMVVRLWGFMMVPVVLTVILMWAFQIYFMEQNYVNSNIADVQEQLDLVLEDLAVVDLAHNETMVSYLSSAAHGKMMIVDDSGSLISLYSYGYAIDLEESLDDIQIWQCITEGEEYHSILSGTPYTRERMEGVRINSYETGIPVTYDGQDAYVILYRSIGEL